ncbi:MAG: outer membrane lipoprotein carrier protein LolA [Acidobacteriota bacterium]|jgi:outer membrane lipoprotein-sorting protein
MKSLILNRFLKKSWILAMFLSMPAAIQVLCAESENKLESVLAHMEQSSKDFQSFKADIQTTKYTSLLDLFDPPEKGKFYYSRSEDGSALIRWEITVPGIRILTIEKDEALLYRPKIKSAQKYKLGKNKDKAEYLALGIGQSPADLEQTFDITFLKSEKTGGKDCSVLEMKPKDPKTASMFSSILIWVDDTTGVSTRMKLIEPYDDYLIVDFSNEKLNEKIEKSMFRQKLPNSVEVLSVN